MDLSEMPPSQCYNINARFGSGRLVELPIKDDQRETTSTILRKYIPRGAIIEEGFVTLSCSKPGARKSWIEKFLVVESIGAGGTDEYVAILGATAPSEFRESLSSDGGTPTSFPIGFSNLSKEEQDKQENERKESASKAADEERKQKEQERKDREEQERAIEAQSQNPRAQM